MMMIEYEFIYEYNDDAIYNHDDVTCHISYIMYICKNYNEFSIELFHFFVCFVCWFKFLFFILRHSIYQVVIVLFLLMMEAF